MNSVIGIMIFLGVIAFFAIVYIIATRYKTVPPNQALVVYGARTKAGDGSDIHVAGGTIIWPIIQHYQWLDLEIRTLDIKITDVVTKEGVMLNVEAVTQVQIDPKQDSLKTAANMLLEKDQAEIDYLSQKSLEGHVRGVCATLTIEQINSDRDSVSRSIQDVASSDLKNMGLNVVSFTIRDISDRVGYLEAMGKKRTAEVKEEAIIGQAQANMRAQKEAALRAREGDVAEAEAITETRKAQAERDRLTQEYETEVEKSRAIREKTYEITERLKLVELVEAEKKRQNAEKDMQIEVMEKEKARKEKEQDAQVRIPANAQADKEAALAEGKARALREQGNAEAEVNKIKGKAAADVKFMDGDAEANVVRAKGLAEAEAIRAKGLAEAEAMNKKAEAWEKYGSAAMGQIVVDKLPEIAEQLARPLEHTEKLIIMGSDAGGSRLVGDSVNSLVQVTELVKSLVGVDISEIGKNMFPEKTDRK